MSGAKISDLTPEKLTAETLTVGLGILSWRGHASLDAALQSYKDANLFSLFDEVLLFLPEPYPEIEAVAKNYPVRVETMPVNRGIARGMEEVATRLSTDYILMMENDCPLVESREEASRQIQKAIALIDSDAAIMARMRSVRAPGELFNTLGKYRRYWGSGIMPWIRRTLRPGKARRLCGSAVYDGADPATRHPDFITDAGEGFSLVSTAVMPWTNQSILIRRKVFLDIIMTLVHAQPYGRLVNGYRNVEIEMNNNPGWTQSGWSVACGPGLFTHKRAEDRGY